MWRRKQKKKKEDRWFGEQEDDDQCTCKHVEALQIELQSNSIQPDSAQRAVWVCVIP